MNKSALALAGFGFAAGVVLLIVVEPLIYPAPPSGAAPQDVTAMVTNTPR
jgi:hypothetical protein